MNIRVRHSTSDIPTIIVPVSPTPDARLNAVSLSILRSQRRLQDRESRESTSHLVALLHELEVTAGALASARLTVFRTVRAVSDADEYLSYAAENDELAVCRLGDMAASINCPREAAVDAQLALIHLRRAMHHLRRALAVARAAERAQLN